MHLVGNEIIMNTVSVSTLWEWKQILMDIEVKSIPITLWSEQSGLKSACDIFKHIFLKGKIIILVEISVKVVPEDQINTTSELVWVIAWGKTGGKPLPEQTLPD